MLSTTRNLVPRLASLMARQQLGRRALLSTTSRMKDSEDPLRKQGDWPRTKEERERAAKKYNLIPEDYEPYPEGLGWGDYPNLKCIGDYNKDWYDDYTDILESKHYGQPIELHSDLYFWERIDPLADERPAQFKRWQKNIIWFFLCISPFAVYWFFNINPTGRSIHPNHRYKFKECNSPGTKFYWFPTREKPQHH